MAKKARKKYRELEFEPMDEFEDLYDNELDVSELAGSADSEWGEYHDSDASFSARRRIERRNDMKKLYSQLDEWEQFGDRADW